MHRIFVSGQSNITGTRIRALFDFLWCPQSDEARVSASLSPGFFFHIEADAVESSEP